ncbi:hypothetical protein [Paraburkholderia sp. DGU8]|uniref:hypothetical protein n=1 Tax=Paraburkholderia sp. DGU8 TaxID=3161997 RepID=UPI003466A7A0
MPLALLDDLDRLLAWTDTGDGQRLLGASAGRRASMPLMLEDKREIVRLRDEEVPVRNIAKNFGKSPRAIYDVLDAAEKKASVSRPHDNELQDTALGSSLGALSDEGLNFTVASLASHRYRSAMLTQPRGFAHG